MTKNRQSKLKAIIRRNLTEVMLVQFALHFTLKPFKNFTYSVVFQNRQALRHEENKAMKSFEGSFRN